MVKHCNTLPGTPNLPTKACSQSPLARDFPLRTSHLALKSLGQAGAKTGDKGQHNRGKGTPFIGAIFATNQPKLFEFQSEGVTRIREDSQECGQIYIIGQ